MYILASLIGLCSMVIFETQVCQSTVQGFGEVSTILANQARCQQNKHREYSKDTPQQYTDDRTKALSTESVFHKFCK